MTFVCFVALAKIIMWDVMGKGFTPTVGFSWGGGTRPRWGKTPRADVSTLRLAALGGEGEFWIV